MFAPLPLEIGSGLPVGQIRTSTKGRAFPTVPCEEQYKVNEDEEEGIVT